MRIARLSRWSVAAAALTLITTSQAVVTFNFTELVTGDPPQGTSPWATLTISNAGANTVDMTLSHNAGSAQPQFLTELLLNVNPFPGNLTLIENSPVIVGHSFSLDGFNDASGRFDMMVEFETSNSQGNRLEPGESVSWQVTGTGLTENSFLALSTHNLNVYAMVHVQGIGGQGSGKIAPIPEPASFVAMGGALLALLARKRRR